MVYSFRAVVWYALGAVLLLASACRKEAVEVVRINPKSFTATQQASIGTRIMDADWGAANIALLTPEQPGYRPEAFDYLQPLLGELVAQASVTHRDSFDWRIHLVMDTSAHAYTLPGGQIVLHTGMLHSMHNEAELVGVLAREIALGEQGAAMDALTRAVGDNVLLGDVILDNEVDYASLIQLTPKLAYSPEELAAADSLAAVLVCPSNYLHEGLLVAVQRLDAETPYRSARPAGGAWAIKFEERVAHCVGTDSTYRRRYQEILRLSVPR